MSIKLRNYSGNKDFQAICNFLTANYQPDNTDGNWLEPRWEYMHFRSDIIGKLMSAKSVSGKIIVKLSGWRIRNHSPVSYFCKVHSEYGFLKEEMLDYAEQHMYGIDQQGEKYILLFVYDTDEELIEIIKRRGYQAKEQTEDDYLSQYSIPDAFPEIKVPAGFKLKSIQEENDPGKVQRVLYRGFDHPGEPPADQVSVWETIQTAPNYRRDTKYYRGSAERRLCRLFRHVVRTRKQVRICRAGSHRPELS